MALARAHRNAHSPACRIPSEILARCFWFLGGIEKPDSATTTWRYAGAAPSRPRLGWLKALHVCGHWRQVAISYPNLWAEIDFSLGPIWARTMVIQSKAVPITLNHHRLSDENQDVIRDILQHHAHHIKSLSLTLALSCKIDMLSSVVDGLAPAPMLESLTLSTCPELRRSARSHPLPTHLFMNCTPRLRHLTLHGAVLPDTTFGILSNVTNLSLSLSNSYGDMDLTTHIPDMPSPQTMLSLLGSPSRLEHLSLTHFLPHISKDVTLASDVGTVTLPYLTEIRLEGPSVDCAFVLRHLNFPQDARLSALGTTDELGWSDSDRMSTLFSAVASHTHGDKSPRIRSLSISSNHSLALQQRCDIKAWDTTVNDPGSGLAPQYDCGLEAPVVQVQIACDWDQMPSFASISGVVDLTELRTLDTMSWTRPSDFIPALASLKQLRNIAIGGTTSVRAFLSALVEPVSGGGSSSRSQKPTGDKHGKKKSWPRVQAHDVFLPSLIVVDIADADFDTDSTRLFKSLLKRRKKIGKPLQRLGIWECTIEEEFVAELEEIVPKVDWDGETGEDDDEDDEDDENSFDDSENYVSDFDDFPF